MGRVSSGQRAAGASIDFDNADIVADGVEVTFPGVALDDATPGFPDPPAIPLDGLYLVICRAQFAFDEPAAEAVVELGFLFADVGGNQRTEIISPDRFEGLEVDDYRVIRLERGEPLDVATCTADCPDESTLAANVSLEVSLAWIGP